MRVIALVDALQLNPIDVVHACGVYPSQHFNCQRLKRGEFAWIQMQS